MYFWNTGALARELHEETISEAELVKYFLVSGGFYQAAMYVGSWIPNRFSVWTVLNGVTSVVAMLIGIVVCAKANREGDNKNFLPRVISLSWPLGLRFFVLMIPTYILFDLLLRILGLHVESAVKYETCWYDVAFSSVFFLLTIWRLRIWIRVASGQNRSA